MPGVFLTDAERTRFDSFPADLTADDLITYFRLSESDLNLIAPQRGAHNRLGIALQLCTLRFMGSVSMIWSKPHPSW